MHTINMQTEDYKKYVFTEQENGSWMLSWEDCGEVVSELFTSDEQRGIVVGWMRTGFVNF